MRGYLRYREVVNIRAVFRLTWAITSTILPAYEFATRFDARERYPCRAGKHTWQSASALD
jgi:hypothetical protein